MCRKGGISEFCDLKGDIRIDPNPPIVYYVVPTEAADNNVTSSLTIKPYARNDNAGAMESVREWTVKVVPKNHQDLPHCSRVHDSPGVIFSLAGFCGNVFHSFSDVLIPLFATARPFNRQVKLLITDYRKWFIYKFIPILQALSRYEMVDIDDVQEDGKNIHCFSRLTLGLKGRQSNELSINTSESEFTIIDFKKFLRSAYSLRKTTAIKLQDGGKKKLAPVLLIVTRRRTRALSNVEEVERMAVQLGFKVTIAEIDANVSKSAEVINSCDVVLGVHGAALTNMVFLPENAVQIQVVPFDTDWIAKNAYGDPTKDMGVRYLEYKIGIEESSLSKKYPPDHAVLTNPKLFVMKDHTTEFAEC
ncbi:unnamed protein product [Linum tenue]|uniref:Glycosyltransferase 61 catalytic domain-containing protein n=3 Tax=Linum tenue TaxID=586396 RepID=A0AAV0QU69_9ROSI|nr:unnamed protein product [Linum tenue]